MRRNEEGFALIAVIMVLAALSVVGISAVRTSTTETQIVRNSGEATENYFDSEAAIIASLDTSGAWLTDDFLTATQTTAKTVFRIDPETAGATVSLIPDPADRPDPDGRPTLEVRCIVDSSATVSDISDGANEVPQMAHETAPPPGSGFSSANFVVRRYAITATAGDGTTQVQAGMWRIFNKP